MALQQFSSDEADGCPRARAHSASPQRTRQMLFLAISLQLAVGAAFGQTDAELALRAELRERDAVIADLLRRVEALEGRSPAPARADAPATASPSARPDAGSRGATAHAAGPAAVRQAPAADRGGSSEPGTLDVDELAAERALERTLTSDGALLLPKWSFEVEPFAAYARREDEFPQLLITQAGAGVATTERRRNEFDIGVRGRLGLPFDAQLELELPYRVVSSKVVRPDGLDGFSAPKQTGDALGDIKVGVAKTLLTEAKWWPDLVGRITWNTGSGSRTNDNVALSSGYASLRGSLVALKRQDPLAFTLSAYYETAFERDDVEPGDQYGFTFGASLALSPETALSMSLAQSYAEEQQIGDEPVRGSDGLQSLLLFGVSSMMSRNTLLSVSFGVGLTDAAPEYIVGVSLPMRW
jgi:hypothetical protein